MMSEEPEEPTYTSAEEWPTDDDGGQDMTLPSGAKVRIAAPPVMWLAATGKIPANLVAIGKRHEADKKDWTPAETDRFARSEVVTWGQVIRDNNITMD